RNIVKLQIEKDIEPILRELLDQRRTRRGKQFFADFEPARLRCHPRGKCKRRCGGREINRNNYSRVTHDAALAFGNALMRATLSLPRGGANKFPTLRTRGNASNTGAPESRNYRTCTSRGSAYADAPDFLRVPDPGGAARARRAVVLRAACPARAKSDCAASR